MPIPGTWDDPKKHAPHAPNYPVITNVIAVVTGTSVVISWTTDVPSSSQVFYGILPNQNPLPLSSPYNATPVTSHSVSLTGLIPNKFYFFYVISFYIDALTVSGIFGFTTGTSAGNFILLEDGTKILLEDGTKILMES